MSADGFLQLLTLFLALGQFQFVASAIQTPLQSPGRSTQASENLDNRVFASLHSLLKSWSQAFTPHGRAVVPATIKPGTLLYHMAGKQIPEQMPEDPGPGFPAAQAGYGPPTGMEWLAYVSKM